MGGIRGSKRMDERRTLQADGTKARERGIDRVLRLLDCLHHHGQPIRIGDLARAMNAPRSSTYEIVRTLVESAPKLAADS